MRILLLTNEYPPNIYGGAGVHVEHLCRELVGLKAWRHHLHVQFFGDPEIAPAAGATPVPGAGSNLKILRHPKLLDALYRNLLMTGGAEAADVIHCHTWYTYLAGLLLKPILKAPLVITAHSLEPHRPWKRDQLGAGYHATCWLERTAFQQADRIIAVSSAMKEDIMALYGLDPQRVSVIYNGIDPNRFHPVECPEIPEAYGIDPSRPYVLFVGRVTHQKGILHLLDALVMLDTGMQIVLCAGAPDTPKIADEMTRRVKTARQRTDNKIVWIDEMVPEDRLAALYSHAAVFVCPSIYEPFGIINLEAMACATPVVAAAVGGIPEVVKHGETGLLVPFEPAGARDASPRDPQRYAGDLARAINLLMAAPQKRTTMGYNAKKRVEQQFTWRRIAEQTLEVYESVKPE